MPQYNPVEVTKASCIDLDLVFTDEAGAVEDVSDDTFTVAEPVPAALGSAVLTKTAPVSGRIHFHLDAVSAAGLGLGNVNRFRVRRTGLDGCAENSEEIWISVQ